MSLQPYLPISGTIKKPAVTGKTMILRMIQKTMNLTVTTRALSRLKKQIHSMSHQPMTNRRVERNHPMRVEESRGRIPKIRKKKTASAMAFSDPLLRFRVNPL